MDDIFLLTAEQEAHYSTMYSIVTNTLKNYEYQPDTPETREYKKTNSQGITVYLWYKESAEKVRQALIENGYNIRAEHEQLKTIVSKHHFVAGLFPADTRHALLYTSTNPHKGIIMPNYEETLPILMVLSFSQPRSEQAEYWRKVRDLLSSHEKIKLPPDSKFLHPSLWTAVHELYSMLSELSQGDGTENVRITEIPRSDFFYQPISKAWREQIAIAKEGDDKREINVGENKKTKIVIIEAEISDREGNPLQLTEVHKGIQRAVGNLIDEAGGRKFLPITVTPAQIYRAYRRASYDTTVTEQQARETEEIMDYMLFAPSMIDFKAQLDKHKNIKQQSDYDYDADIAGKIKQPLVPAQKTEVESSNGYLVSAYKIYDYPTFYAYSHIVNQIAMVPNVLLTGGDRPPARVEKKTPKTAESQWTARTIAVRQYILTEILLKCSKAAERKRYNNKLYTADIAAACGISLTVQTERTLKKTIKIFLEELVEGGKLKKFSEHKTGRKIDGFTVEVTPRK
jgi:hypothetical protein